MKKSSLPIISVVVEAQPWSEEHIARIASMRVGGSTNQVHPRKKIQTQFL